MTSTLRREFARPPADDSDYPTTDGRPMAETNLHRLVINMVIDVLIAWFAKRPDIYVHGNMLLYYEKGDKRRHVSPDCLVTLGIPNYLRDS